MVLLQENVGKRLLSDYGIRVPRGAVVSCRAQLDAILQEFDGPVVLKAQILSGARGKNGGIRFANGRLEAERVFDALLGATINDIEVGSVLVEDRIEIAHERYVGFSIDSAGIWLLIGRDGGVEIEETSLLDPGSLRRIGVQPAAGPDMLEIVAACDELGIPNGAAYAELVTRLFRLFFERDALLAEINPVAELANGTLMAVDARVTIDDAALCRQPDLRLAFAPSDETGSPAAAESLSLTRLNNGGAVGYVGLGGGIGLTIMDWISARGQRVSALTDIDDIIASGRTAEGIARLFELLDADPEIRVVLLNIVTCGYDLAEVTKDILDGLNHRAPSRRKPVVFHLHGNREARAAVLLATHAIHNCASLADAVDMTVAIASRDAPV